MPDKIRVLIADDSGLMRLIISDIINSEQDMEVIGTASDGEEAVQNALRLSPDVLVLDMYMGKYDGTYVVKHLLQQKNLPILILSSMGNSNLEPIVEALHLGAFDYVNKPKNGNAKVREVGGELLQKIRLASRSVVTKEKIGLSKTFFNQHRHTFNSLKNYEVIVIGASTGGPSAVEKVIRNLPENLPVPVLVAQHMPANFVPPFVNRLNAITPLEVKLGRKGDVLAPGSVIIAPGSRNIIVTKKGNQVVVDFTSERFKEFNYPSVNALFLSAAEVYGNKALSVILTGMGRDGAHGAKAIFDAGGYSIAQSEESSAVFGMPKAVVETGCVNNVVPLNEIGGFIVSCLA